MLNYFHAYDIRGNIQKEITPNIAYYLGNGLVEMLGLNNIITGYDARLSGPDLSLALASGIKKKGGGALSLGLCCTEEIYWASQTLEYDGFVMITASHNPAMDNGFKIVRKGAIPIGKDNGLKMLEEYVERKLNEKINEHHLKNFQPSSENTSRKNYIKWLLDYCPHDKGRHLKIVADCGNGCAGLLLRELVPFLPHQIILYNDLPDGTFPHGAPNPLLPEKRHQIISAVIENNADFGVAFDGDADRCFFVDHAGKFVEGYYIVGLLAKALLQKYPGEKIIHDPRLYWNTREVVIRNGGIPIKGITGHVFMKERMRRENAIYGGEISSHHYFRDFGYCDTGMLPFMLVTRLLSNSEESLAELLKDNINAYPCSGEINRKIENPDFYLNKILNLYKSEAMAVNLDDGLDMQFKDWRFSLRKSNTEPLIRLNVESRGNQGLLEEKTSEILSILH